MNLIRSAQHRMFRQLRFSFTTSSGQPFKLWRKNDHAPSSCLSSFTQTWSFLSLPEQLRNELSSCVQQPAPLLNQRPPLTHILGLLWNRRLGQRHISDLVFHWRADLAVRSELSKHQKVLTTLKILTDRRDTFVKNPSMTQKSGRRGVCVSVLAQPINLCLELFSSFYVFNQLTRCPLLLLPSQSRAAAGIREKSWKIKPNHKNYSHKTNNFNLTKPHIFFS